MKHSLAFLLVCITFINAGVKVKNSETHPMQVNFKSTKSGYSKSDTTTTVFNTKKNNKKYSVLILFLFLTQNLIAQPADDTCHLPDLIPFKVGNKYGYCDKNMKLVIPATYQYAMLFSSYDYFEKSKYKWRGFFLSAKFATIFKDKMVSRINKAGKVVCSITQALYSSESFSCYFLSRVRAADGHWNFDHIIPEDSADRVIDSIFKLEWKRNNISRRAVFYQSTDTTFSVIDYGDTAIYSAEPVRRPTGNFYIGKRGNKFGLLTDSNKSRIPFIYDAMDFPEFDYCNTAAVFDLLIVKKGKEEYYIDFNGREFKRKKL